MVSNTSAQLIPDNTLISLTIYYRTNWIWRVNGRLQFPKSPTRLCTKISQMGSLLFLIGNIQRRQNFTIWNPGWPIEYGSCWSYQHAHSRATITKKAASRLSKVSRRPQKIEIYLGIEESGPGFSSTDLGHIFQVILEMNLEWCWEELDLTNQKLQMTLFANTRSWYR